MINEETGLIGGLSSDPTPQRLLIKLSDWLLQVL